MIAPELSTRETTLEPVVSASENTAAVVENKPAEPISVLTPELSQRKTKPEPTAPSPRQKTTPTAPRTPRNTTLSPIQIGFLLIVLSTVMSSLYNVAIKVPVPRRFSGSGSRGRALALTDFGQYSINIDVAFTRRCPTDVAFSSHDASKCVARPAKSV